MESLTKTRNTTIGFVQPKVFERVYELRSEDQLYGVMRFPTIGGSLAYSETADGFWTFKRTGFFVPQVTIRETESDHDYALFSPKAWDGGTVNFSGGTKYYFRPSNFWRTEWKILDEHEQVLFEIKPGSEEQELVNLLKTQCLITIQPSGFSISELPLLVMLGWYLVIMQQADATIATFTSV